jgi:hypothetical protein
VPMVERQQVERLGVSRSHGLHHLSRYVCGFPRPG